VKLLRTLDDFPETLRGGAVGIGNFDGVHLGHARLVERLRAMAQRVGGPAVVFTFDPSPTRILRPDAAPEPLLWLDRKIEILNESGADAVLVYPTDKPLLEMEAREFFDRIVRGRIGARAMVEGPNFFFGHHRSGDVETLRRFCAEAGIPFEVAKPVEIEGQIVSSSRIRSLVMAGRVDDARAMLGRPHRIRGVVSHGAGRGARIGFPTANLEQIDTLLPGEGIYAARALVLRQSCFDVWHSRPRLCEPPYTAEGGCATSDRALAHCRWHPAAVSLGPNPTFDEGGLKVEAHLLGFQGTLYGQSIEVDFLARLREIRRFGSVEALLAQMARDVAQTLELSGNGGRGVKGE
jgi:riboflavin kinase / FMN adenylyltransferase